MTGHFVKTLAGLLEPHEREAVLGDLAEYPQTTLQTLRDLAGLLIRRQAGALKHPAPWLALPLAYLLSRQASGAVYGNSITIWLYANNWDWNLTNDAMFRWDLAFNALCTAASFLMLACCSWTAGLTLAAIGRPALLLSSLLFAALSLKPPIYLPIHQAVFDLTFYRVVFPLLVLTLFVVLPAIRGLRKPTSAPIAISACFSVAVFGLSKYLCSPHFSHSF